MANSNGNGYSKEFRPGTVKLLLENRQNVTEVCRNLGVSRNALERWLAAEADSHEPFRGALRQCLRGDFFQQTKTTHGNQILVIIFRMVRSVSRIPSRVNAGTFLTENAGRK